ncbi:MAG: alanine racemase [Patescibacteria group bacterium]
MRNILRKIRDSRFNYEPLVRVNIFQDNIIHNYSVIKAKVGDDIQLVPVLKGNAYGHGLVEVAQIIKNKAPIFLAVDSFYEAQILRNEGVEIPILIIGFTNLHNVIHCRLDKISFILADLEWLREMASNLTTRTNFHLKIDTGMNRQGVEIEQLGEVIDLVKSNPHINLEGLCSHLADADSNDQRFTSKQIEKWNRLVKRFKRDFPRMNYFHLGASSSLNLVDKIDANMIRLGLSLYGMPASENIAIDLRPALQVKTIITTIRAVKKGEKIGYSGTFRVPRDMLVASVPMGYFEGIDRRLSNCGFVKVSGIFCPIVGRVSMNITMLDVSDLRSVHVGDEVEIISVNNEDKNSVMAIANLVGTIPYEIMVHVERKLKRYVI